MSIYPNNTDIVVNFSPFSSIWQFTPVTQNAEEFFENDCGFESWQKLNGTYAVDHRPAKDFARFLSDQGFSIFHPQLGFFQGE